MPGGVNSPVRAMRSIGRDPIFIASGSGPIIRDVDGNEYIDWVCSWGPLILGHAHPEVVAAVTEAAARGTTFGAPTAGEVELAERDRGAHPVGRDAAHDLLGHRGDDERHPPGPRGHRPREDAQVRRRLPRPRRRPARRGGSGLATQGIPASPGVPAAAAAATVIVPWNDPEAVREAAARHGPAAIVAEPVPANMGVVPPQPGFLEHAARRPPTRPGRCSSSTR